MYLLVNIPQGMFIDLDDPFEAANFETIESTPISGNTNNIDISVKIAATSTFFVTNRPTNAHKSSVLSFRAQLHSAIICDIEQPAFVSGQHVLVWEIDNIVITKNQQEIGEPSSIPSPVIEFATKLHLRYPHPSSILEEWIDLLRPILFSVLPSDYKIIKESDVTSIKMMPDKQQHIWDLDFVERVWVAAGNGDDHSYVMGMTISFCLIGVVIMLRDISRASLWDNG